MKRKGAVLLTTVILGFAVLLGGCGSSSGSSAESGKASEGSGTAKSGEESSAKEQEKADSGLAKDRSVRVVTSGSGEPYSLIDDSGKWTGIDAEIWEAIGEKTGWKIEKLQATGSGATFGQLDAGRADVAANCYAVNAERTKKYLVSDPYYGDAQCVVVKPDSEIRSFDDLKGKKVGVLNGQAAQQSIEDMGKEKGFEVTLYEGDNGSAGYQDVLLGRLDAFASTDSAVYKWENGTKQDLRFLDERLYANDVAYYFPRTEEGRKLRDEVNVVLAGLMEDGTITKIVEKYMYSDMTQNIIPYSELGYTVE